MGNFFNSLAAKIETFMMGRNGADKLSLVCLIAAVVIGLINSFIPSIIFTVITWALLIYSLFRCFSTNVAARQAENEKFENLFSRGSGRRDSSRKGASGARGRKSSSGHAAGNHKSGAASGGSANASSVSGARGRTKRAEGDSITFQCDQCGQKLSVPKGKGTLKITCPKCHHQQKINS